MPTPPPSSPPRARVDVLGERVRWLDRYRRLVALCAAAIAAPLFVTQVGDDLGADWPELHITALSLMLGAIVWWITEVGLAYLAALWETEQCHLVRDRDLPRAVLVRR
ncbi:MAG TPA: hypothetical protein VGC42_15925 [Kofleriaceae bacterium]